MRALGGVRVGNGHDDIFYALADANMYIILYNMRKVLSSVSVVVVLCLYTRVTPEAAGNTGGGGMSPHHPLTSCFSSYDVCAQTAFSLIFYIVAAWHGWVGCFNPRQNKTAKQVKKGSADVTEIAACISIRFGSSSHVVRSPYPLNLMTKQLGAC